MSTAAYRTPNGSSFRHFRVARDLPIDTFWCYMHASRGEESPLRHCVHPALLHEFGDVQAHVTNCVRDTTAGSDSGSLPHLVLASDADVFNLGGDLDLFSRLIRSGDRDQLLSYAHTCVRVVHSFHTGLGVGMRCVALVQGDALGGGFEAALSCGTIVAEAGVRMGLPEVLFDLFPGMGAYSFLVRRLGPAQTERMILSGEVYSSDELHRMGVVDVLARKGEGHKAVEEVIRRARRTPNAHRAIQRIQAAYDPVSLDELIRVTEIWVDTALQLGERSLKTMARLVRAQGRRMQQAPQ